ncbi:glycosyltransferase [Roseibium salinum]|nr:glycosyltransferase [Roseibium salinum]
MDTGRAHPDPLATFRLPDGTLLTPGDPVVTFAARDLEPYRGFPQFMRAAAIVAKRNPHVRFLIAGGDGVSYGQAHRDGGSWRDVLMKETGLPPERTYFLGQLPHDQLIRLFQVSAAHVYLTYPFVLSWSFLEAMACGAPIIASATAPVQEVISEGKNGRLADFWDVEQIAHLIERTLGQPPELQRMRTAARQTVVSRFGLAECVLRTQDLLQRLIGTRKTGNVTRLPTRRPATIHCQGS